MDAGVLQLHVFQHDSAYEPMRLGDGESITPRLKADSRVARTCQVSLVIPTFYNQALKAGSLTYLLDGLESSHCVREVILVAADDNATRLEQRIANDCPVPCVVTSCAPNRRAQARNVGARAASCPTLLFLDDDMLLQDWRLADVILAEMLKGDFDVALFPRRNFARFPLLYQPTQLQQLIDRWRQEESDLPSEQFLDPVRDGSPFKTMAYCFPGCFMLISRSAYDQLGGFPEEFEGWGFEDTDFALRAVRQLKVLNLFRSAPPLLHIDHPVSPYKSDEYRKNLKQFSSDYETMDMDWLCRKVFEGHDFRPDSPPRSAVAEYCEPMHSLLRAYPLSVPHDEVLCNYRSVLDTRLKRGLDPMPAFMVLTGSRGAGTHSEDSDHDLLVLFRGGGHAEYFVTRQGKTRVEIECAGQSKYETLASAPAVHPTRSPLELAKLAQARVLWGNDEEFSSWRSRVLGIGIQVGLPVWLLCGIGMRAAQVKFGVFVEQYFEAMTKILGASHCIRACEQLQAVAAATVQHRSEPTGAQLERTQDQASLEKNLSFDTRLFQPQQFSELLRATRDVLDRDLPEWRTDMAHSKRVFAVQVPEIWTALRLILESE